MTAWERAVEHMVANGGIARRDELVGLGVARRTVYRRQAAGLLRPVNASVVALPGTELDLRTRTRAAVLARPALIPTGPSSAAFLGPGPWDRVAPVGSPWLVGPKDRLMEARFVSHPGVSTLKREGMLVADAVSTVIDLLRFLGPDEAQDVGRAALQRRVVTIDVLLVERARLGRVQGVRQLDEVIRSLADGTHAESERQLVALMREAGVTGWQTNHHVVIHGRRYFIDVAFPGHRLAIEVDGREYHSDAAAFERDRRRQNDLIADGWRVLRFTWRQIVGDPHYVISSIVAELQARAA